MSQNNFKVTAIIVAAGSGARMGGVAKPLIKLGGSTVIERVLGAFEKASTIDNIVVVCRDKNELFEYTSKCKKDVTLVLGGATRTDSVRKGVLASDGDFVCIHDCARPFVTPENIDSVVNASFETGAATACAPMYDTVKYIDTERNIIYTPERSNLVAVQTPQVFKKDVYLASYAKAVGDKISATDDTALAEHAGFSVKYVTVGAHNFKLTDAYDVKRAKALVFLESRGAL